MKRTEQGNTVTISYIGPLAELDLTFALRLDALE